LHLSEHKLCTHVVPAQWRFIEICHSAYQHLLGEFDAATALLDGLKLRRAV
jgi:hypothetical protein